MGRKAETGAERRRERRVDTEVGVSIAQPELDEPIVASTRNVSGSGAYIVMDDPLPMFGRYHVHLLFPVGDADGKPAVEDIEVVAIVVRHSLIEEAGAKRHCVALYFDRVSPTDRERIIDFVDAAYS